jgi:hypothetical protein
MTQWVEKPADSPLTVPAHFDEAIMKSPPGQRRDRTAMQMPETDFEAEILGK